jgi:hypothetical protein
MRGKLSLIRDIGVPQCMEAVMENWEGALKL